MRVIHALSTVALVCGVWRSAEAAKHFEPVYSWTEMDFVFPSDEVKAAMVADHQLVHGDAAPMDMAVDSHTGRTFIATPKITFGVPYSLSTVSETKNAKGEHLLQPYPSHEMHTKGCDGISSISAITIDECGRLWAVDVGFFTKHPNGQGFGYDCPVKMWVIDLKTDHVIKNFSFPHRIFQAPDSFIGNVVVEVLSTDNECRDSFAYVADSGRFDLVVHDLAHDEAWVVEANVMYPDPEFGHFHYKGLHFDAMYGVHGMVLTHRHEGEDRNLYFHSMASGKDSYMSTSVLRNKTHFADDASHDVKHRVYSAIHTVTVPRPGGQSCLGPMVDDVVFYGSYEESAVYCGHHKHEYNAANIVQVDRDEEAFDMFARLTAVTGEDGVTHLYVLSNSYDKFLFGGHPDSGAVLFRILKAPTSKLVEGTPCAAA